MGCITLDNKRCVSDLERSLLAGETDSECLDEDEMGLEGEEENEEEEEVEPKVFRLANLTEIVWIGNEYLDSLTLCYICCRLSQLPRNARLMSWSK